MTGGDFSPNPTVLPLCPFLLHWEVFDPSVRTFLSSHAALTPEGWWLIDPTPLDLELLKRHLGNHPVLGILLTNENHERGSSKLAEEFRVPVHCHEILRDRIQRPPDFIFPDEASLRPELKTLPLPGASFGETAYYFPELKLLVVGDALIHLKETGFALLPEKYCQNADQLKQSLTKLLEIDFQIMAFAHGFPLTQEPKTRLRQLLFTEAISFKP